MSGLREALEQLRESWSLEEIVKEAIREAEWCCEVGCGSGACETCPCCCAGYCVSGRDGLPNDDPEEVGHWLEIAAEHNPAIASLRPLLRAAPVASRERVAEVLREFGHPTEHDGWVLFADELDDFHNALLAAGVFRDDATVKAEALVEAARRLAVIGDPSAADWLESLATLIRQGVES